MNRIPIFVYVLEATRHNGNRRQNRQLYSIETEEQTE
jgi:hypothetical protein